MVVPRLLRRRRGSLFTLAVCLLLTVGFSQPSFCQTEAAEAPDLDAMEAELEAAFTAAVEMSSEEPVHVFQAWEMVLMNTVMLERMRSMADAGDGADPPPQDVAALHERVLARWQRLRPEAGGPDVFRAIHITDRAERRAAILALLDRYPDDLLVIWQVSFELRGAGEIDRANQVVEGFLARNPDSSLAYRLLAQNATRNGTRLAEVLERWARAIPGDPEMVRAWLSSVLPRQEPEATDRVLREFFARRPGGGDDLDACHQVLERGGATFTREARACVARIAGDPEVSANVAARATSTLLGAAAADGDWSAVLAALDGLEPGARVHALIAAATKIETPQRCGEALDLLAVASEALGESDASYPSVAYALTACSEEPEARELFRAVLRQAPADQTRDVVRVWATNVYGDTRDKLPEGTAAILERRLQEEPAATELLDAADLVYELAGDDDKRFELLRRRNEIDPDSLSGEQAIELAYELLERDEPDAAVAALERRLDSRFEPGVVEAIWELHVRAGDDERAERFAAGLFAHGEPARVRAGHALAARSALEREDFDAAEGHYWKALAGDRPQRDVAVELLAAIAWRGDAARLEATARRICEETRLDDGPADVPGCAADLLTRVGAGDLASELFAAQAEDLPEDLESLQELAWTAKEAGNMEVAELARRRILELDPRSAVSWTGLAALLAEQGRADEVLDLLARSRERFPSPPHGLHRSAGRALLAAGEPRRAIEHLMEARGALPDTEEGDWGRGEIDRDLKQAYRLLGQEAAAVSGSAPDPAAAPMLAFAVSEPQEFPSGATASQLRAAADALRSGQGGRYDPEAAKDLYARAAALGDPLASFRLALLRQRDPDSAPEGTTAASELYRGSAQAVEARAAEGEAYAQLLVGTAALVGLGGPEDFAAARRWLEAAAAQGESWAWHNLAWMAETGRGFEEPDPQLALASYRRASEAGNTQSMIDFAGLTLTPDASGARCDEGRQWLERSAGAGNARAASFLGKLLFYGRGDCVARDPDAALPWLEAAAATRQPGGAYDLGLALVLTGPDGAVRSRGLSLLEEAANGPDALAVETLAFLRATGVGVERDLEASRRLMVEAARLASDGFPWLLQELEASAVFRHLVDHGIDRLEELSGRSDSAATALLARLYSLGFSRQSEEVEPERTVALARQAAAAGEASAMRVLMYAYRQGDGVEADEAEASRWRQRCAEAGDSFCMMFLGTYLMQGEGAERDVASGLAWLRRAAEAGNWWAVADLGDLYDRGRYGTPRNPDEAAAWKRRLAELGDQEASGWLLYHGNR